MSNDKKRDNVIDMTERISAPDYRERLKSLKVRFDLEQSKIAVATSLLSIVLLVTLANNNMLEKTTGEEGQATMASTEIRSSRGIASVPGAAAGTIASQQFIEENSELVRELAKRDLGPSASIGREPSGLEQLAFGYLEGKYAVRLQNGKIREIEFTDGMPEQAKAVGSFAAFLESQRSLLPEFDKSLKIGTEKSGEESIETYQLVNQVSMPVAKVQFRTDDSGRMLGMTVSQPATLASK